MKNLLNSLIFVIFLLSLIAWDFGYGPPYDSSKPVSAKVVGFGQIGVFTYKKVIYKPATGWRAFPDGGIPAYLTDTDYIAVYDFLSQKVRIIHKENNLHGYWINGRGEFFISATYGKRVLISQGGQRRSDLKNDHYFYWVDLDSGKLTKLPLQQELVQRGLQLGYLYLIDEGGTLVMVAPSLDSSPNWTRDTKVNPHLLIRHPNGTYDDIAQIVHYYGVKNKDVHYWSSDNKPVVYNLETKTYRAGKREGETISSNPEEFLNINVDLRTHYDNGYKLQACKKSDNQWVCDDIDLAGVF